MNRFLLTPLREGRRIVRVFDKRRFDFYSRPCGRGDVQGREASCKSSQFLLTPLREGRRSRNWHTSVYHQHFYSRPCGRGDASKTCTVSCVFVFLLTPLREGRQSRSRRCVCRRKYFYSRPCGRGDQQAPVHGAVLLHFYSRPCGRGDLTSGDSDEDAVLFLLTPLREGRHSILWRVCPRSCYFYSRPCGRGDEPGEDCR